jgi:hypothetical protein
MSRSRDVQRSKAEQFERRWVPPWTTRPRSATKATLSIASMVETWQSQPPLSHSPMPLPGLSCSWHPHTSTVIQHHIARRNITGRRRRSRGAKEEAPLAGTAVSRARIDSDGILLILLSRSRFTHLAAGTSPIITHACALPPRRYLRCIDVPWPMPSRCHDKLPSPSLLQLQQSVEVVSTEQLTARKLLDPTPVLFLFKIR